MHENLRNLDDDPALKSALRRIYGGQAAPLALRQRITGLTAPQDSVVELGRTRDVQAGGASRAFWSGPRLKVAAAVAMLLLAGLIQTMHHWPAGPRASIPSNALARFTKVHDQLRTEGIPAGVKVEKGEFVALGKELAKRVGSRVLAADLSREGWRFQGAWVGQVNGLPAAHFMYARGSQSLSVFSMPAYSCGRTREGREYAEMVDGHPVAGFVENGMVFVMVGDGRGGSIGQGELARLMAKHRQDVVGNDVPDTCPVDGPKHEVP